MWFFGCFRTSPQLVLRFKVLKAGGDHVGRIIDIPLLRISKGVRRFLRREKDVLLPGEYKYGVLVGRSSLAQLVLGDQRCHVSRLHFLIVQRESGFVLLDLKSVNKTFHNGESIDETLLVTGDTIKVLDFEFRVSLPGDLELIGTESEASSICEPNLETDTDTDTDADADADESSPTSPDQ